MRHLAKLVSRSRLLRGVGANIYAQAVTAVLQLVSVPIFSHSWGLSKYGVWLMLFTIPSCLSLADFGFATAAGNDMTMAFAKGDRSSVCRTFHSVIAFVAMSSAALFAAFSLVIAIFFKKSLHGLESELGADVELTLIGLFAYGFISLFSGVVVAGFRSIGNYATGTSLQSSVIVIENIAAITGVLLGFSPVAVGFIFFAGRLLGIFASGSVLYVKARWLFADWSSSIEEIRRIMHPAIAVMAVPVAQSVFLQGTVLVVGVALGNSMVPVFTAVRTLSRLGIQSTTVVNHALMPEYSIAFATHNKARQRELAIVNLSATVAALAPLFVIVVGFGHEIVRMWTHGAIDAPFSLILPMAMTMALNGTWWPWANLVLSLNQHSLYSYVYLLLSVLCVGTAYPLAKSFGLAGAAGALVALDLTMLVIVWRRAGRLDILAFPTPREIAVFWGNRLSASFGHARS